MGETTHLQLTDIDLTMVFMDETRETLRGAKALADATRAMRAMTRNCILISVVIMVIW